MGKCWGRCGKVCWDVGKVSLGGRGVGVRKSVFKCGNR